MIVGICGKMGSGKDTVADYLRDNYEFIKISFATKVKRIAKELFGYKSKDERGRYVLQQVGSLMRKISDTVWIDWLFNEINRESMLEVQIYGNQIPKCVISDVRYTNEAERVLNENGILIVLDVDSNTRRVRCQKRDKRIIPIKEWEESEQHGSETGVDDIMNKFRNYKNCFILTDGAFNTKDKIFSAVREILNLKKRH